MVTVNVKIRGKLFYSKRGVIGGAWDEKKKG